ncbi:serine/threonine-protein kinase [Stigmatella sp. ncwal1]|uniref:Serine/threonine-protein kinase n=1 Tax=Stigmatella ashevillensis TaxID=2995309 RepID=A0ABT5D7Q0_9BACT|nr:serine/threonine-protein kinase [Stigmatella ashevillena]MDC0709153.1 serine/threonine-protein kinase [Stigmatella ashevillena]
MLGSWEVDGRAGYGTYGVVYRAHRRGQTEGPPVALKLARHPNDWRFGREAELLSRIQNPCVPRLLGRGTWKGGPRRETHPYLVMQWVEGVRLYEWAKEHAPTPCQMLRVLAQVARALATTHAGQGLHRDVKGDNVLVSPEGQAFLMDFGCGTWKGATPLTEGLLAPGTRIYRSPQALRFHWNHRRSTVPRYEATPADDVYALGVTAYRLCTGVYPPIATDPSIAGDEGRDTLEVLIPPGRLAPLTPEFEALLLRMLSDNPQDRGTAAELAAAMEALAGAAAESNEPMKRRPVAPAASTPFPVVLLRQRGIWPVAGLALVVGLLVWGAGSLHLEGLGPLPAGTSDGRTSGVADAAVEEFAVLGEAQEFKPSGLSLDMPKEPLLGQRRPPCSRPEISLRGGCWVEVARDSPPCGEGSYAWKDACYYPVPAPPRPSTSDKQ